MKTKSFLPVIICESFITKTCFHNQSKGAFNVAMKTITFDHYVNEVTELTSKSHKKIWVPRDFLAEQGVEPYRHLPFWRPQQPGFYHINVNKSLKAGLESRSIKEMVSDQLEGYVRRNPKQDFMWGFVGTISRQKERKILDAWAQNS